jgi:hypothetical protein
VVVVTKERGYEGLGSNVRDQTCGWSGCGSVAEATLEGRALCRNHFYDVATKRLEEHRTRLQRISPVGKDRIAVSRFLTEMISEATTLVAKAKLLAPWQRDQFFELSLAGVDLFKRVQRNPRTVRNMPILIYRETDSPAQWELTNTVDVSKQGACVATNRSWESGEKLWIEKPTNQVRAQARIAWVKTNAPSQTLIGLEIQDCEDFWGLGADSPMKKR